MLFLLLRLSPIFLPIVYYFTVFGLLKFNHLWLWWFVLIIVINLLFTILLALRKYRKKIWFVFVYLIIYGTLGAVYATLLSNQVFIAVFVLVWSIMYFIYLEAIFNTFYRAKEMFLIGYKNIAAYTGLASFFVLVYCLTYFYTFLNFDWWLMMILFVIATFALVFDRFIIQTIDLKVDVRYASVIVLVLLELLAVLVWWSVSIYVVATILSVFYYLFNALALNYLRANLTPKLIRHYLIFSGLVLVIVLLTTQWF
jgi:hypothetical protein